MITVFKNKKDTFRVISQQYEVGLYVAWYKNGGPIPHQIGRQEPEEKYHKKLRKEIKRKGSKLIEKKSTTL